MSEPYYPFRAEIGYYADRAEGRVSYSEGALGPDEARTLIASQHGEPSWEALERRLATLDEEPFRQAYLAVEAGDEVRLAGLLDAHPWLTDAQGTNGNDLLNMSSSFAVARLLLERGADPARGNDMGWTPLHQVAYGNNVAGVRLMLEHGGRVDAEARGAGGTPLVVALFWGHREAAGALAEHGTPPGNLRVAAGLGRQEEIAALAPGDGRIGGPAGAARGFYRPHSGFPPWTPSEDAAEVLDEALAWAARSDRVEALALLVERGARVDADVYRGTALAWAAACGRVDAIEALIALGAEVDGGGTFGGPDHGEGVTALQLAAQSGKGLAVRALLAAGADPSLRDARHDAPAWGWASFGGHDGIAAELRNAAAG